MRGRIKHLYSIWTKLRRQGIGLERVYDFLAFRLIVDTVPHCYAALGLIHQLWRPVPGRIKDYIAMPKPNAYQSLHTSVIGPEGQPFEVQIRTRDMDEIAERGIAAHWLYKEGRQPEPRRRAGVVAAQPGRGAPGEPARLPRTRSSSNLYPEEVYTFTPKGEVFAFARGATPIDFAYRVHTEVGHHCVGARINGKLVPLRTAARQRRHRRDPHLDRTRSRAATGSRSRSPAARAEQDPRVAQPRREGAGGRGGPPPARARVPQARADGQGAPRGRAAWRSSPPTTASARRRTSSPRSASAACRCATCWRRWCARDPAACGRSRRPRPRGGGRRLGHHGASGQRDLLTYRAQCCNPLPGDEIVGYVTRGRGVAVHAANCPNVRKLLFTPEREVEVEWGGVTGAFAVPLHVGFEDRPGMLASISQAANGEDANIRSCHLSTNEDRLGTADLVVDVNGRAHLGASRARRVLAPPLSGRHDASSRGRFRDAQRDADAAGAVTPMWRMIFDLVALPACRKTAAPRSGGVVDRL